MGIIKKDQGQGLQRRGGDVPWGPFQVMRDLMRMDPFQMPALASIERDFVPSFEVRESDKEFSFTADLPGVKAADLDIELVGNRLEISGKREDEKRDEEGMVHTYERMYGSFMRAFVLPENADIDKIASDLKDGVLTITVPKKPGGGQQAKKIEVKTAQGKA
ncbi:MAG: HSP20 family small heat-shock protein [Kofleriaceae bacterium]|nr:HSP20 family small heat-shock protein [Kofleriaceae bacterium]